MKKKALLLIIFGVVGVIFILNFDVIMGKSVNDVTGPKSFFGFFISFLAIFEGIKMLIVKTPQDGEKIMDDSKK